MELTQIALAVTAICMVAITLTMIQLCSRFLSVLDKMGAGAAAGTGAGAADPGNAAVMPASVYTPASPEAPAAFSPPPEAPLPAAEQPAAVLPPIEQMNLHGVDERTAAMLMAIVADKTGFALEELRFLSIKEC
ncbi:MAG: hypothetical protein FWF83_06255 [Clostridiales bacterium]|nr:hypothetical protein [Clostridiales bacterium]